MRHKMSQVILGLFLVNSSFAHVVEPQSNPHMPMAKPKGDGEIYVPSKAPQGWVRDEDEEDLNCEHGEDE